MFKYLGIEFLFKIVYFIYIYILKLFSCGVCRMLLWNINMLIFVILILDD